jgi:hypothetical protein
VSHQFSDAELIAFADTALRMTSAEEPKVRPGSLVWHEAVRMIASHLKFLQQHGTPIPRALDGGLIGQQATAELLQRVREQLASNVVAEVERHAHDEPS